MFFYESDDSDELEDFLFLSMDRYDTLQMFSLDNIPYHILQIDETSICVASKRRNGQNSELLKLQLPKKLTLPPEEEGRSKESDFKVLSGIYTENLIYQMNKLENDSKIITSENNSNGLQIYSFTGNTLGNKKQEGKLDVTPWTTPDFAIIQETANLVCSKCCHEPVIQVDTAVGQKVKEIKHPFHTPNESPGKGDPCFVNNVKCKALSCNTVVVLNTYSGEVALHDLRTADSFISLPGHSKKVSSEVWTLSGCDYRESFFDYFGILANTASFCIYDKRKNSVLFEETGNKDAKNYIYMKLKFSKKCDQFSISGMNCFVEVFSINNTNFDHIFTHNGHCPSNLPSVFSTDHIWLETGSKEYIVSTGDNGTLHCWDHKAK